MSVSFNPTSSYSMNVTMQTFSSSDFASSFTDLYKEAMVGAFKEAAMSFMARMGVPADVRQEVGQAIDQAAPETGSSETSQAVRQNSTEEMKDIKDELVNQFTDAFENYEKESGQAEGASGGNGGKSWFVALMKALGEATNRQAEKVKALGEEVSAKMGVEGEGSQAPLFDAMEELKAEAKVLEQWTNSVKAIGDAIANAQNTSARPAG